MLVSEVHLHGHGGLSKFYRRCGLYANPNTLDIRYQLLTPPLSRVAQHECKLSKL